MADYAWTRLDADCSGLTDPMRDIAAVGEQVAAVLDAFATVLEILAPLLVFPDNPLKAIVNAIIDTLIAFIEDILSNNCAVAFHTNLEINKGFTITAAAAKPDPTRSTGRAPNFQDGDIPFEGTGLSGFVQGLTASIVNNQDPWAPVQNSDGNCGLFMGVIGAPAIEGMDDFWPLIQKFYNFSEFKTIKWKLASYEEANPPHMKRLGSAFMSRWCRNTGVTQGQNAMDAIWEGMENELGPLNPLKGKDGERLSLTRLVDSMPIWRSIPIARLFGPPLVELMEALRDLLNSLKFPASDALKKLVEKIAKKVRELQAIIEKLSTIIETLAYCIDMLSQFNFIIIPQADPPPAFSGGGPDDEVFSGNGGIVGCLQQALMADDRPDYGEKGVVLGTVALINTDDGMDNFTLLWNLLGGEWDALKEAASERFAEVSEAWNEGLVEDALDDSTWNTLMTEGGGEDWEDMSSSWSGEDPVAIAKSDSSDPGSEYGSPESGFVVHYDRGETSKLDGTTSSDADGSVTYNWHIVARPSASGVADTSFSPNNTAGKPELTLDSAGEYDLELTVTDNTGNKAKDQITLAAHEMVVTITEPSVPTTWAVGDDACRGDEGEYLVYGEAYDGGDENTEVTYTWTFTAVPSGSSLTDSDIVSVDLYRDPVFGEGLKDYPPFGSGGIVSAKGVSFVPDVAGYYTLQLECAGEAPPPEGFVFPAWTGSATQTITITIT